MIREGENLLSLSKSLKDKKIFPSDRKAIANLTVNGSGNFSVFRNEEHISLDSVSIWKFSGNIISNANKFTKSKLCGFVTIKLIWGEKILNKDSLSTDLRQLYREMRILVDDK